MKDKNNNIEKNPNAVTTPGGMLLGILGEVNDMKVFQVKRDGKYEIFDVEYIRNHLDRPITK
jgi:hypothetical protein